MSKKTTLPGGAESDKNRRRCRLRSDSVQPEAVMDDEALNVLGELDVDQLRELLALVLALLAARQRLGMTEESRAVLRVH